MTLKAGNTCQRAAVGAGYDSGNWGPLFKSRGWFRVGLMPGYAETRLRFLVSFFFGLETDACGLSMKYLRCLARPVNEILVLHDNHVQN